MSERKAESTDAKMREAMDRYAELEELIRQFPPRKRFEVVPTADKWRSDITALPQSPLPARKSSEPRNFRAFFRG